MSGQRELNQMCVCVYCGVCVCWQEVMDIDEQPYNLTAGLKCNRNKNRYVDVLASEYIHTPPSL